MDGAILSSHEELIKKIYDGSIFCSCKSDKFVEAMLEVIKAKPDNIIVEASGLANPYTMLREINLIESKGNVKFKINVFCLVDPKSFEMMLSTCHAIKIQVAESDVVILNKIDLSDEITISRVEHLLTEMSHGLIIKTTNSVLETYVDYPEVEKGKTTLIEDLVTQKVCLKIGLCDLGVLDEACKKLSEVSHRIKGIVKLDGKKYVYEYVDGRSKLKDTESQDDNFLIVLSCMKAPLKKNVKEIIKDYYFLEIDD